MILVNEDDLAVFKYGRGLEGAAEVGSWS